MIRFYVKRVKCECESVSCSIMFDSLQTCGLYPTRLFCPWNSPDKNTGVGSHSIFSRGIFPTQGLNLGLLHCRQILYCLLLSEPPGKPLFAKGRVHVKLQMELAIWCGGRSLKLSEISPVPFSKSAFPASSPLSPTCPRSAAAAAKSLQSCPTLCDPVDGSPPGSPVPGILQARTLEWVAIAFSSP